tara:strand:- start:40 stop:558 length:519 start_codon:yes stop_codon:yes gene_type:complete
MIDWFKDNRNAVLLACSTLILLGVVSGAAGCSLQDFIKVDVPEDVQLVTDAPVQISLADAQFIWDEWEGFVDRNTNELAIAIGDAEQRYQTLSNVTSMGIEALTVQAGQIPGGAILVTGLSLLTGLFLKKPGTDKVVAGEKENSYNAGIESGKKLAIELMTVKEDADGDAKS